MSDGVVARAWSRLRVLVTGRVEWVNPEDSDDVEIDYLSFRDRWSIFGIHSYNWKWVRRKGIRECGCTFNPITRRKVLTYMDCSQHGRPLFENLVEDWHGKANHERPYS